MEKLVLWKGTVKDMERTLSDYEKIKKAEEIYNRRKMRELGGVRLTNPNLTKAPRKEWDSVKKMVLQICICIVLYFIVYLVQNSNYIFSEEFMNKTKELMSYDVNFKEYVSMIIEEFKENKWFEIFEKQNDEDIKEDNIENTEGQSEEEQSIEQVENGIPEEQAEEDFLNNESMEIGDIGGSEAENNTSDLIDTEISKSQMELDADIIKENYILVSPLKGTITSPYGERSIAPKFHVGVDIGANTGSEIVSAMDGVVTLASDDGDYGKHIKISAGDLTTLYAHCSKLLINEGQEIKCGQKIAEVGQTGNATGPHLHFEIMLERSIC